MKLHNQINILNNENASLKLQLNNKLMESQNLQKRISNILSENIQSSLRDIKPGEVVLAVQFNSTDQKVNKCLPCKNTTLFVRLEELLYEDYPEYRDFNIICTSGGNVIKRFKSMQENGIKNSDVILLNIIEK